MRIRLLLFLPLLLALACQDYSNPAPAIDSIDPDTIMHRTRTPATIKGRHFYAGVRDRIDKDDPPVLDTNFEVTLGEWSLSSADVTFTNTETIDIVTPLDLPLGIHDLVVTTPGGRSATIEEALEVFEALLSIEDAPGGAGNEIGDARLAVGRSLTLYAVARNTGGSFLGDQEAAWSVLGDIGTLDTGSGTQAVFTATTIGTGSISAEHELYGSDLTGTITVVSCQSDADCHNPTPICSPEGQCRGCTLDAECQALEPALDRCDALTGSCLPCLEHGDCGIPWPYCEPGTNTCVECLDAGHCDDANVCTDDACTGFACSHTNNTGPCDDGLFCNGTDACSGGACATHSGDPCPGTECNTCNEADDNCFDPAGTACTNDGLFCTGPEECNGTGTCSGTGDPCPGTECNTCNEAAGNCFDPPATPCADDGLFCTGLERCDGAGACASAGNPCTVPADCDDLNDICGACGDGMVGGAEDCDPGASQNDNCCDVGNCTWTGAGIADPQGICSGAPECQVDVCDGGGGCTTADETDGTPCTDDGDFCTGLEECAVGACASRGDPCPGTECNNCNESADNCFDPLGTPCSDDGDPCTTSESCDSGACMSGPADKDGDNDTHIDMACGGGDCDDTDGNIHPGADDSDCDNIDDDCDSTTDGGYIPAPTTCGTGVCASTGQLECQTGVEVDTCAPGAPTEDPEATCDDSLDNDCDTLTDGADADCLGGCLVVDTNTDESDAGESPSPPHLGTGLSLREAIIIANTNPGTDCIVFSGPMTIQPASNLPATTDDTGLSIDGAGVVLIDGSLDSDNAATGLEIQSSNNTIQGLEIANFSLGAANDGINVRDGTSNNTITATHIHDITDNAIKLEGSGTTIGPGNDLESCSTSISVSGSGNTIYRCRIHDNLSSGISLKSGGDACDIYLNFIYGNGSEGVVLSQVSGVSLRHNTIHENKNGIVVNTSVTTMVVENNIFSSNTDYAIDALGPEFTVLDHCDFFGNTLGDCSGCSIGANSITDDPLFTDAAAGDFSLLPGSPAIDRGTLTGLDVNGPRPGDYDGSAPDMGAFETTWFDNSWLRRRKLTFLNLARGEDLADFPVLVILDSSNIDYNNTQDQGQDLRFVDSDDLTVLPHEIEDWNEAGISYVWVKVPQINRLSDQDFIWMYYGNDSIADGQDAAGVWSTGYTAVYHLHNDLDDSSPSGFSATNNGTTTALGAIADGQDFDGSSGWVNVGNNLSIARNSSACMLSAWVKADTIGAGAEPIISISTYNGGAPTADSRAVLSLISSNDILAGGRSPDVGGMQTITTPGSLLSPDTWYYVAGVIDYGNDEITIYIDGSQAGYGAASFSAPTPDTPAASSAVGSQDDGSSGYLDGIIDEVRISGTVRSADWINAQHASMTGAFVTFGLEESIN